MRKQAPVVAKNLQATMTWGNLLSRLPYNRGSRADIDAAAHRLAT